MTMTELLPLPLSTFEKYMLADDRPEYPMAFVVHVAVSGRLRRDLFHAALEETLDRHPMLCALVDRSAPGGPCWVSCGNARPVLDWQSQPAPLSCPHGERIDLSRESGLRIWVREGDDAAELTFQVHHACCDGLGMLQVVGDLLAAYGIRTATDGQRPVLQPLEPARLRARGRFTVRTPASVSRTRALWGTVRETAKWLGRSPTPLCVPQAKTPASAGRPAEFPGILTHRFDQEQTRRLRTAARQHEATLNDVLLRDLFQTVVRWNQEYRPDRKGRWLRINMPANLRERQHDRMPAANVMSQTFVTRHWSECDDPAVLLQRVHWETDAIKRWRLGLYFLGGIAMAQRIPGALPIGMALAGNRCYATTVMTNVGDVARRFTARFPRCDGRIVAGDLVLDRVVGVPPLRPKTYAGFGAVMYAGELHLMMRGDPRAFSPPDSQRLLGLYIERLNQTIANGA